MVKLMFCFLFVFFIFDKNATEMMCPLYDVISGGTSCQYIFGDINFESLG